MRTMREAHRRNHPRVAFAILAVLLLAGAVLAACGRSDQRAATTTTTESTTTTTTTTTESTTSTAPSTTAPSSSTVKPAAKTTEVTAYFLHDEKLVAVHRRVPATPAIATAAVRALLAGPTAAERARDIWTAVPAGTTLNSITIKNGLATVDMSKAYESGGGSLSMASRLAQVVFTVTQFPGVQRVQFRLDGKAVTVFGGEGLILDHPTVRADFEELMPAIFVESPAWGDTVSSPVRVRGTANVFEALFRIEITDWDGRIVATRLVMASSGTGTRGTFDVSIRYSAARTGNGAIIVSSESPKDGSPINVIETPLTVKKT